MNAMDSRSSNGVARESRLGKLRVARHFLLFWNIACYENGFLDSFSRIFKYLKFEKEKGVIFSQYLKYCFLENKSEAFCSPIPDNRIFEKNIELFCSLNLKYRDFEKNTPAI